MNKENSKYTKLIPQYTLFGILFGLIFPILGTLNEIWVHSLDYSWQTILLVQQNHLLWIIDSAPLFLGLFAYNAGVRHQRQADQTDRLGQYVEQRSKDIIRQKLFYEALVDNNPIATVTLDQDHKIISVNPAFESLFGYYQDEVMGKNLDDLISNPDRPQEAVNITRTVMDGNAIHEFGKRRRKDGQLVDVEIFGEQIRVNDNPIGVLGLYRDITAEKQAQEALSASEERFRLMFDDSPVALRMEDYSDLKKWLDENIPDKRTSLSEYAEKHPDFLTHILQLPKILDLNDATLLMFGAKDKQEMQHFLHTIVSTESFRDAADIINALRDGKTTLEAEIIYNRLDGRKIYTITKLTVIPGHEKDLSRILFSNMDITERKLAEERLTYISLHDIMTGIYNRAFFEEEMSRLEKSRFYPISILVMDMDNLKKINDTYGHQNGDVALQNIAAIIKSCFRSEDVVARIGGDEMAVLLQGLDEAGAYSAKARILAAMEEHNHIHKKEVQLSVSIGCATANTGNLLLETFKLADERMYQDKKRKKDALR